MDKKQMKLCGIIALCICVVCLFVAVERYRSNANNVRMRVRSFKVPASLQRNKAGKG